MFCERSWQDEPGGGSGGPVGGRVGGSVGGGSVGDRLTQTAWLSASVSPLRAATSAASQ